MASIAYYIPAAALLICAALYVAENKVKQKKWLYNIAIIALHIFVIVFFLFLELTMEILLLFLLASLSLALSINVKPPKE